MPVATPDEYAAMLDTAKAQGFAFPAINVSSSSTINAVLQGLKRSDRHSKLLALLEILERIRKGLLRAAEHL